MTPIEATSTRRSAQLLSYSLEHHGIPIWEEAALDQRLIDYFIGLSPRSWDTLPTLVAATSAMVRDLPLSKRLSLDREYYPELYV